jgi:hypothetical protein
MRQGEPEDSDSDTSSDEVVAFPEAAVCNPDGTASTATPEELHILRGLNKQPSRMAAGRFGGRAGKLARIQAQEAQAAVPLYPQKRGGEATLGEPRKAPGLAGAPSVDPKGGPDAAHGLHSCQAGAPGRGLADASPMEDGLRTSELEGARKKRKG